MTETLNKIRKVKRSNYVELPDWTFKILRDYNGFSGIERIRGWQLIKWLEMVGMKDRASDQRCQVTGLYTKDSPGGRDPVVYHSENYYAPWEQNYYLLRSVHFKLHNRFKSPEEWKNYLVKDLQVWDASKQKWLFKLPAEEVDFADILRDRYGQTTDNMMERFLAWLPKRAEELGMKSFPLPSGKLLGYDDFMYDDTRRTWERIKFSERSKRALERKKLREMGLVE